MTTYFDEETGYDIILPDPATLSNIEDDEIMNSLYTPHQPSQETDDLFKALEGQYNMDLDAFAYEDMDSIGVNLVNMDNRANASINMGFSSYHYSQHPQVFSQQSNESISFQGITAVNVDGKKLKEDEVMDRANKIFTQQYEQELKKNGQIRQLKLAISEKEVERHETTKTSSLNDDEKQLHDQRIDLTRDMLSSIKEDAKREDEGSIRRKIQQTRSAA